jgi:hypothetical protein
MNKKAVLLSVAAIIIIFAVAGGAALYLYNPAETPRTPTGELDFTVTGSSDCLRFLNSSVPTVYVPFTIEGNNQYKLIVNSTKMPGGANGWTDVYIYKGYWDKGTDHICKAQDLYPIINDIKSADFEIKTNQPYTQTFGHTGSGQDSYTIFFVLPPGGQATFHITLKQA